MSSGYPNSRSERHGARWRGPEGSVLVEVKRSSNARDLRDALLALTYALAQDAAASRALCVLTRTKFSERRLQEELARFRSVVRPDLGERVFLAAMDAKGQIVGELPDSAPDLGRFVAALAQAEPGAGRVSRQAVKAFLVECWLDGQGPQSVSRLKARTGASYPTVAAALEDLRLLGVLSERHAPRALLREPSWEAWRRLAEGQAADRKIIRFVDPSGQARRPLQMERRLRSMRDQGAAQKVAIGGVLGALLHDPELDISTAPRLDLCVYDGDTRFMRKLDAALVETDEVTAKAAVVLHLARPPAHGPLGHRPDPVVAPPLDCMADLLEMGYQAQARDFALALNRRVRQPASA